MRNANAKLLAMQLDKFSDYALRILITLAVRAPERVATSEIAGLFAISDNHLSKVATQLAREGFVRSERGRNGGLTLLQPAEEIRIGVVLRALKREEPVAECFGGNKTCLILPVCGLRGPLAQAQEAFFATLDGYTLADIVGQRSGLASLLRVEVEDTNAQLTS
jgi:Rrf2 family nitric oxide-sensitive transcriptional repressor